MTEKYRNNGAIGALLDEYERSIGHLIDVIKDISDHQLVKIVDNETMDLDCRSIQSILSHVVRAGNHYAISIRRHQGEELTYLDNLVLDTSHQYVAAIIDMFKYTEKVFQDYPDIMLEENNPTKKILVSWGQRYDVEQLMEHAIVHILRHRRQIERFLLKMKKQ